MAKFSTFFKQIIWEIIVVFILVFSFNNYLENEKELIKADGVGYYDYLPSVFIHHDINRKDKPYADSANFYKRIDKIGGYTDYHGYKLDKYPCGTAILISPFFLYTYESSLIQEVKSTGYEYPYQRAVFFAAVFYFFLTLLFFKKLLELYNIKKINIVFLQLLMALATGVTIQINYDSSGSHTYSLFAITAFLYFAKSYFIRKKSADFLSACIFLALIILLRNINFVVVFFIPFLAGSSANLKFGLNSILKNPTKLMFSILCMAAIIFIQSVFWYLQTGKFIVYSYTNEGFNFSSPAFISVLFSYRKGLFLYTPILFISLFGLIRLAYNRQYYLIFTWLGFFLLITYIFSSWWCWYYGCSFGMRVYIDFYPIFFILFALLINNLILWLKFFVVLISSLTIVVNLIQSYQYKNYILHWDSMTEKGYWEIFLKQEDKYKGYLWKRNYDFNNYILKKQISLKRIIATSNTEKTLLQMNSDSITQFNKVNLIQIEFDNNFSSKDDAKISLTIKDSITNNVSYYFNPPLIFFAEQGFNKYHTGIYNLEVPQNVNPNQLIKLSIYSSNRTDTLNDLKVTFFIPR